MREDITRCLADVVLTLRRLRVVRVGLLEATLVDMMVGELERAGIEFEREAMLAPRCRIDLAVPIPDSSLLIGVEAKKGRPNATSASAQVARYAGTGRLAAIVFVAERAFDLPLEMSGVPVRAVSLQAGMGIAL